MFEHHRNDILISCPSQSQCLLNFLYLGCQERLLYVYFCSILYKSLHIRAGALTRQFCGISVRFFQWDLVCDRKSLSKMTATVFFLGVMLGAIAFGYLSDKYVVSVVMERLT